MNAFQLVVLVPLLFLVTQTIRGALHGQIRKRVALMWLALWLGSAAALLWPKMTVIAAKRMGIGRGADLVMYLSVLLMLVGFFYIYTRFRRLDRQITQLVRALAVENPRRPNSPTTPQSSRES